MGEVSDGIPRRGDEGSSYVELNEEKSALGETEERWAERARGSKRNCDPDSLIEHIGTLSEAVVLYVKTRTGPAGEDSVQKGVREEVEKQIKPVRDLLEALKEMLRKAPQ